jgi:hypothetical protein
MKMSPGEVPGWVKNSAAMNLGSLSQ